MKKLICYTILLSGVAASFGSCKKALTTDYNNPELSTQPAIPGFFTAMLSSDRVRPAYWNLRTFFFLQPSVYAQTTSFDNVSTAYMQTDSYTGQYWSDFYYPSANGSGPMALYRAMQATYNGLSPDVKTSQDPFMQAAKVFLYDAASKMVDLWGDVPFSGAGALESTSSIKNAGFDDAKTLYSSFISGLDSAATYFGSVTLAANTAAAFGRADILLKGSPDQWRRYANSIRLRLLMRISFEDETTAKTAVTAMLSDPANYPLIDGGGAAPYNPAVSDVLLQPLTTTTSSTLFSALTEIESFFAPDYMLNTVMLPANDPRIPVLFDKFGTTVNGVFVQNPTYQAMPITFTSDQQSTNYTSYSIVDSTTFLNNVKMPGVVITSPEVNFLKAEAFERWGGGDPQAAYNLALLQSISFYFYLNNIGGGTVPYPDPTATANFLSAPSVAYTGTQAQKLANIYTQ